MPRKGEEGMENCPASYIMDAIVDSVGQVWVASEGEGVWKKTSGSSQWENMVSTGFPEQIKNCYALAEDRQGRIWIGTDHEGVMVWNGKSWRQYTQVDGPIGERIFDIEINKRNGIVALATSGGLTLYDPVKESWTDVTREDGLYSDQINSIAFDEEGTMYAAYQCGGVGISLGKNGYQKWILEQSRWFWDREQRVRQPAEANGLGLASNLCNDIACDGKSVWLATSSGLARREARQWVFLRGRDYQEKNKGVFGKMPKERYSAPMLEASPVPAVLPEDYVTALHPAREGLWVGFRKCGAVLLDARTLQMKKKVLQSQKKGSARWVCRFVEMPSGAIYAATYGAGFLRIGTTGEPSKALLLPRESVSHPLPRKPLSGSMILKRAQKVRLSSGNGSVPKAFFGLRIGIHGETGARGTEEDMPFYALQMLQKAMLCFNLTRRGKVVILITRCVVSWALTRGKKTGCAIGSIG